MDKIHRVHALITDAMRALLWPFKLPVQRSINALIIFHGRAEALARQRALVQRHDFGQVGLDIGNAGFARRVG